MSSVAPYSSMDRLLHKLAFAGPAWQKVLADLEDRVLAKKKWSGFSKRPVFVTSLPRAGTTLFLEILTAGPEFVSHTYRDMPFVLCPLFWDMISRNLRKEAVAKERAHGDGIEIGYDSPEAFEEIIWMAFWAEKYHAGQIEIWPAAERNQEFESFFHNHLQKLVGLRSSWDQQGLAPRYISKNNANMARIELLVEIFPDCQIVIPFRNPLDHLGSLLRQQKRFSEMHGEDPFNLQYMEGLGHFEFGAAHRPLNFANWLNSAEIRDPADWRYWLAYWSAAYEAALAVAGPNVHFVDYDRACAAPRETLAALAAALELEHPQWLLNQAPRFREPSNYDHSFMDSDSELGTRVARIHGCLLEKSI